MMDLCMWMKEQLSKGNLGYLENQTKLYSQGQERPDDKGYWMKCNTSLGFSQSKKIRNVTYTLEMGRPEMKWKPPSSGTLKLNIDAKANEDLNLYSIRGIVRDKQGRLLLAFGKQIMNQFP